MSTCVVRIKLLEGTDEIRLVHKQLFPQSSQGWSLCPPNTDSDKEQEEEKNMNN